MAGTRMSSPWRESWRGGQRKEPDCRVQGGGGQRGTLCAGRVSGPPGGRCVGTDPGWEGEGSRCQGGDSVPF